MRHSLDRNSDQGQRLRPEHKCFFSGVVLVVIAPSDQCYFSLRDARSLEAFRFEW